MRRPAHAPTARLLALVPLVILGAGCPSLGYRWPNLPRHTDGAAHFIVFHIGQADAMLVLHRGRSMLVDAGATWTKQDRQNFREISRRLEALTGRRHLDYLVVSHYHQDHIGLQGTGTRASVGDLGLWALLSEEGVTIDTMVDRGFHVIGPKGPTQRHYEDALQHWLSSGRVRRRISVKVHDLLQMGDDLRVEVMAVNGAGRLHALRRLNPLLFERFPPSENDSSIVLKLTKGDFELVTGGDLSGQDLTRSFGPSNRMSYSDIESVIAADIGDVEVYRVHHHGSGHSSNDCFVQVLSPEVSIFSVGMNSYGHPALRVFRALRRTGKVYLTSGADQHVYEHVKDRIVGQDVEVIVSPDGRRFWVNGEHFRSSSEGAERALPGHRAACPVPERKRDPEKADETGPLEND